LAGEGALGDERLDLLLWRREPGGQLGGLFRVVGLLRHRQVRAAPIAATAGEGVDDVPRSFTALGVALDDAEEPAGTRQGGEGVGLERLGPVFGPRLQV